VVQERQEQLLGQEVLIRRALLAERVFKSRKQFMLVRAGPYGPTYQSAD